LQGSPILADLSKAEARSACAAADVARSYCFCAPRGKQLPKMWTFAALSVSFWSPTGYWTTK
jgi:hypothetical protein